MFYYILTFHLNLNDETEAITPSVVETYDISDVDTAYAAFAKACYPGVFWELTPSDGESVIGHAHCIADIYNEQHQITLLIKAKDDDACDDLAACYILNYIDERHKSETTEPYIYKGLITNPKNDYLVPDVYMTTVNRRTNEIKSSPVSASKVHEMYEMLPDKDRLRKDLYNVIKAWYNRVEDTIILLIKASDKEEANETAAVFSNHCME